MQVRSPFHSGRRRAEVHWTSCAPSVALAGIPQPLGLRDFALALEEVQTKFDAYLTNLLGLSLLNKFAAFGTGEEGLMSSHHNIPIFLCIFLL